MYGNFRLQHLPSSKLVLSHYSFCHSHSGGGLNCSRTWWFHALKIWHKLRPWSLLLVPWGKCAISWYSPPFMSIFCFVSFSAPSAWKLWKRRNQRTIKLLWNTMERMFQMFYSSTKDSDQYLSALDRSLLMLDAYIETYSLTASSSYVLTCSIECVLFYSTVPNLSESNNFPCSI